MAQSNIEGSVDRISSLPDSVLGHILSFLPTKVAVSSCIVLCRSRWKDVFRFTNNLDFKDSSVYGANDTSLFMDFVDRCIMLKNGTHIDKFRLKCSQVVETSRIRSWICAALCSNVRELDLSMGRKLVKKLSRVFTCNTLVVLKLQETGFTLNFTASVYFPYLKILHLDSINDSPIQRLVSICPVLEDLLLVGDCCMENVLHSPSLKRLTLDNLIPSHYPEYEIVLDMPSLVYLRGCVHILKNLRSLREAHICIQDSMEREGQGEWAGHHELIEGLGNVESLYLSGNVQNKFVRALEVLEDLPLLKNLTRLVLTGKPYFKMSVLMKLLKCCPNLEEFVTDGCIHGGYGVPSSIPPGLKSIECAIFDDGIDSPVKLVESLAYFKKNANKLEKIHILWHTSLSGREASEKLETMMETMEKLVEDPGRSKYLHILY